MEELNAQLLKIIHNHLKYDLDIIRLLEKIKERHCIPFEIRLFVHDVGHRSNYALAQRRGSAEFLNKYGWHWVWGLMDRDKRLGGPNVKYPPFLIELKEAYEDDWSRAADDYLRTLQPKPIRASKVYEELLPDAEKHRFKSELVYHMRGGTLTWTARSLLIVKKHGEAIYLPRKDMPAVQFLGELLLQGPSLLTSTVEGRIKKVFRQVDWHERILDKLWESGVFVELRRKVRCGRRWEIDAVGVGQPFQNVTPNSLFVLEATPTLNYDAFGQVEWYQHLFGEENGSQPHKGIVCEHTVSDEFLDFCRGRGVTIFLVSYTGVEIYESRQASRTG